MAQTKTQAFFQEVGAEMLKSFREPAFVVPTILLPVGFYALFAIALPGSSNNAPYLLATFGIFAVLGPAIFGFGASVANERERGWLYLKLASPAPVFSYILAKLSATLVFSAAALVLIYLVSAFGAGVRLEQHVWANLFLIHLSAAIPFVLVGLTIGFLFSANAAVAVSNIVFMTFAALGGLWMPVEIFPPILQQTASVLPSFHLGQLALGISGANGERDLMFHTGVVLTMSALFAGAALLAWKKQSD